MPDPTLWGLFLIASLVLLLTPGPAVLYIVARSVQHGRTTGIVSAVGIHTGTIVHIAAAAIGISALVVSSALAFAVVKYLGAAYLIWMGIRTFLTTDFAAEAPTPGKSSLSRAFRDGFVVNVFNPKDSNFFPCLASAVHRSRTRRRALADYGSRSHIRGAGHFD